MNTMYQINDIRRYFTNPSIVKLADIVQHDSDQDYSTFNNVIRAENIQLTPEEFNKACGIVYFITIDSLIAKFGHSGMSPKEMLGFYTNMTDSMKEGRYMPHYYMGEMVRSGCAVEIYVELLELVDRPYRDIETGVVTMVRDASWGKSRESDYTRFFKRNGVFLDNTNKQTRAIFNPLISFILNRQESGCRPDDFSRKYTAIYEDRKSKKSNLIRVSKTKS